MIKYIHRALFIMIIAIYPYECRSQLFEISDSLNKKRLYSVSGVTIIGSISSLVLLNETWYKNYPRSSFHSFNDKKEWLQMDKAGHAMTSYYIGYAGYEALHWTGLENKKSIVYGSMIGFSYLTALEILDGFSKNWGFSWGDMLSNSLGTGLFISQQLKWNEQRIKIKFSSHLTSIAQFRPDILGSTDLERILKDYNGQTYWLSANINDFLKKESKFPKWINVAFGYGTYGMTGGEKNKDEHCKGDPNCLSLIRTRKFYLSLDADLTKVKWKSKFLSTFFGTIGFIKIPFPALEISDQNTKFHWFYF